MCGRFTSLGQKIEAVEGIVPVRLSLVARCAAMQLRIGGDCQIRALNECLLFYSLFQMHNDAFARLFSNGRTNISLDGQHVFSIAHSHK
jgi:hypothetical protein